jgi:long-subunit acyl-CoA synthetase (AMP-forming)
MAAVLASASADDDFPWTGQSASELVALAEKLLKTADSDPGSQFWHRYLDITGRSPFLKSLPDRVSRGRWAETAFRAIAVSGYSVPHLLARGVSRHPDRVLFDELRTPEGRSWTYARVAGHVKQLAGVFIQAWPEEPRVAIFADNSVDSACCDLACLLHGIFVTPLNVHFGGPVLTWIFGRLGINIVVTDTEERRRLLEQIRPHVKQKFLIFRTGSVRPADSTFVCGLQEACTRLDLDATERLLAGLPPPDLHAAATAMFTSGSTGLPKGVLFSLYNLVTKRFARAAALPSVGEGEVLLCYLPLYHTFGRYLEMLGTLYWGGTYVFAGNPSVETLVAQMREVEPSGLVSVPHRWSQIMEFARGRFRAASDRAGQVRALREVVGQRLSWGLSAAGFLDARVFRFFQKHGVDLCSGFGMTEATGGISMTPPGEYVDNTVGLPLPGIRLRLNESGELEVAGPYIARYLPEEGGSQLPRIDPSDGYWLATGDLFRKHDNGYLEIVDRIKDIYKNSRGRTIAPRSIEQKFEGVPGVKRVFLVGDRRDYNVLLIVSKLEPPILHASPEDVKEYFSHVVRTANVGVAPYERVVNFTILERDFEQERDELTAKGSYRRRAIEEHFLRVIEKLYESSHVELRAGTLTVRIPRWFYRDLAILETDIVADDFGLCNRQTGMRLPLCRAAESGPLRVGDLEYDAGGEVLDIGLFARQPKLWVANPQLIAFCPCKDGWDLPVGGVSTQVRLPLRHHSTEAMAEPESMPGVRDEHLKRLNALCTAALFGPDEAALQAVMRIGEELPRAGERYAGTLRRRLEALAWHPNEEVRCLAYRLLLLDEPMPDYSKSFPAFIDSGLSFLNEGSIREIARSNLGECHLAALRRRLFGYRMQLPWPANPVRREQFRKVFALLVKFVQTHREYYSAVRAELAAWSLHDSDEELSQNAAGKLAELCKWFEGTLAEQPGHTRLPADDVVFEDGFAPDDIARLRPILTDVRFLQASVMLAFAQERCDMRDRSAAGIWVTRVPSQHDLRLCRVSVNFRDGRHYDLLVASGENIEAPQAGRTIRWMMALSDLPHGAPVLPAFGTYRDDLGAFSLAYVSDLTVWDKIRQFSGAQAESLAVPVIGDWHKLLVRGMEAFFRLWQLSACRLLPGGITPANVAIPEADFRGTALVLSLAGSRPYTGTLSLVRPLVRNFYRQTAAHYPQSWNNLRLGWIFDASLEALGPSAGGLFLEQLRADLSVAEKSAAEKELAAALESQLSRSREKPYRPLALLCAIDRYRDWARVNPGATPAAREGQVEQMCELYRLDRHPKLVRYELFRHTYFADFPAATAETFDAFLAAFARNESRSPFQLEELSNLQKGVRDPADREVFSRMLLPHPRTARPLEILALGEGVSRQVVLQTEILDRDGVQYAVREPVTASELGRLFRLLFESGLAPGISEQDRFIAALDEAEQIVGGIRYRLEDRSVALLELVVEAYLRGRGIGSALLEDFCARMKAVPVEILRTQFVLRRFYNARGFRPDARWGGLVRFLQQESSSHPKSRNNSPLTTA